MFFDKNFCEKHPKDNLYHSGPAGNNGCTNKLWRNTMQGKVEICGVNTARLKTLTPAQMDELLIKTKNGDENVSI